MSAATRTPTPARGETRAEAPDPDRVHPRPRPHESSSTGIIAGTVAHMSTVLTLVSYSRTDSEFAVKLGSDLRAQGADVWLDQLDIEAGSRWDTAVESALGRSARLLVLLTSKSVGSQSPAAQPPAPAGIASGAALQALLALTRQFSARESLGDADLDQLGNAQEDACPNQPLSSPCASAASEAVISTLTAVCGRQAGPPPPRSNEFEAIKYDMKVLGCQQTYLSTLLNRNHEKALGAIRHIRD